MKTFRALSFGPAPAARVGAVAALVFLGGCRSATYVVQVDAISRPPSGEVAPRAEEPRSFKIRSTNPRIGEDNLRHREIADYVKTALSGRGLYEAPSVEAADLIIEIDYGIETPRMKYETVVTSHLVMTDASSPAVISPGGSSRREMYVQQEVKPILVYEKFLKVSARENHEAVEGQRPPEVWSVNVSTEDKSNELRKYLPILASATGDYIGTNTQQEQFVPIRENDDSVKFIRKGM